MDARRIATANWDFAGNGSGLVTIPKGTVDNVDFKIPADRWLNGGEIITEDAVIGDWVKAQVVDVDAVAYPAGTVLKEWVVKWMIDPKKSSTILTPYAGKAPGLMYLRIIYTSIGAINDVKVAVNYILHQDPA